MAKQTWNNPIDKNTDWGGDASTGNLPVSGAMVQRFIKESLDEKAGVFYYDTANNRYLVFADAQTRDAYLEDPTQTTLILGTFDAPFNYSAEITLTSPAYNAVFLNSTGNYLDFTFDVKNKQGASTGENVTITYTFIRNATKKTVSEMRRSGESVRFNVDKYLGEGTNTIIIGVTGQTTLAATTVSVTYQVVNLQLNDGMDISKVYNLSNGAQTMEIPFSISGYGTKVVEWYLDGALLPFVKADDEVVDSETQRTKRISISNLAQGRHSLQIRAYTSVNGENFYTDTLYRDFIVYTATSNDVILGVALTIPKAYGVLGAGDAVTLYDMMQYVPYTLRFASYSPSNALSTEVTVMLDGEVKATISSVNGKENEVSLVSAKYGSAIISLRAAGVTYDIPADIKKSNTTLEEITNGLALDFSANGKSNNSADRDQWSFGDYVGTFNGFNWNETSGWVNGRLEINKGASFSIDYAPLAVNPTRNGKTIEIEWSTKNVTDDDAVICDMRENGVGILITATKVHMRSADGVVIETEYKSDENVRVGFVINRSNGTTNQRLSFIYANGILSRGEKWSVNDSYQSDTMLQFAGSEGAEVSLKAIRIYDNALSSDQMLNNYILYRDSVSDMMEVYDRNDVYEEGTTTFSPDKMMGRLPVMIVTGDIPILENTSDKDTQIIVDIEYRNLQDPSRSFTMKNAAMRPQGTSSMGYPKKNFRIYTQKVDGTILYDANGNEVEDRLYSFKEGAQPVNCWCLKADYAESSGTHNTGIARLWNDALKNAQVNGEYVCRTEAQKKALETKYGYDVRTTIDGFPILLFYRPSANDDVIFIGKYNFNNDKSTESVFGFTGIPNFNNERMQCWEVLNNGNALALFTTTEGFDEGWEEAFEARYPDKSKNVTDLKAFCEWMTNVSQSAFVTEKWEHLNVYMMAAYWCYLMRHAAADQFVKNAMFTSEDGQHFYYILYDNDTINGLINTGHLRIRPTDTRQTVDASGAYVFAGHDSRLWNMLEADDEFMRIVSDVDNALYSAGISYVNTIKVFDEEQADKWVETVYNQDAQYKYVGPYTDKGIDNLFMMQGKRDLHRRWWLAKRFSIYDAKYVSGTYKSQAVELKCLNGTEAGQKFTVTAGYPLDYGFGINNVPREFGIPLEAGESYEFTTSEVVNIGDPIRIYGAPNIEALDLSKMASRLAVITVASVYDEALGTKLKKLVIGMDGVSNYEVSEISGLKQAVALEELDVTGMQNLGSLDLTSQKNFKVLRAFGTSVNSPTFAKGAPVERLELPSGVINLTLEQLPYLTADNVLLENVRNLTGVSVIDCPNVSNDFDFIWNWVNNKPAADSRCSLVMDNVDWNGVSGLQMFRIASLGNVSLKGKVVLTDITEQQGAAFVSVFGETVFDPNSEFYIDAPMTLSLEGPIRILEGSENDYSARVYPPAEGTITYSLEQGRNGASINSQNGVLTVAETGAATSNIVVKATFAGADGKTLSKSLSVEVLKRVYPEGLSISGSGNLKDNIQFVWHTTTASDSITGEYDVVWSASGDLAPYCSLEPMDDQCFVHLETLPPTSMNGTLTVQIKRKSDGVVVSSASTALSYAYVYPTSVTISGPTTIEGEGTATFTASISPTNVDIPMTYSWSISGSYASIKSKDGAECVIETTVPSEDTTFLVTCVVKTSDNRQVSSNFTVALKSRPNYITATYNITSTSTATSVLSSSYPLSGITYMEVDGEEVTPSGTYTFSTMGTHTVRFTLATLYKAFQSCHQLTTLDFSECNGSEYDSLSYTFYGCDALTSIEWGECAFPNVTTLSNTFRVCSALTSLDLSPFEGAPITGLSSTFYSCIALTSLDLSPFAGAPITTLDSAFNGCDALTSIEWGECAFPNVTTLSSTFYNCRALTSLDLSPFEGAPITGLSSTFYNCRALTSLDLSPFAGAPITTLDSTFYNCRALTSLNLSPLAGTSITNFSYAFHYCSALKTIVAPWTTAPTPSSNTFGTNTSAYTGRNTYSTGKNMLIVPTGATGYDSSYWGRVLLDSTKCGFTIRQNGVYIQHINGALFTESEWAAGGYANTDANGAAVLSEDACFVIGKTQFEGLAWSTTEVLVNGIVTTTVTSEASLDFDGQGNTRKIIQQLGSSNAPAANACVSHVFADGSTSGYLPSYGELRLCYNNLTAIQSAMTLIGGETIATAKYKSSTQCDEKQFWTVGLAPGHGTSRVSKTNIYTSYKIRPIKPL